MTEEKKVKSDRWGHRGASYVRREDAVWEREHQPGKKPAVSPQPAPVLHLLLSSVVKIWLCVLAKPPYSPLTIQMSKCILTGDVNPYHAVSPVGKLARQWGETAESLSDRGTGPLGILRWKTCNARRCTVPCSRLPFSLWFLSLMLFFPLFVSCA